MPFYFYLVPSSVWMRDGKNPERDTHRDCPKPHYGQQYYFMRGAEEICACGV